jgi:hypothetical protein
MMRDEHAPQADRAIAACVFEECERVLEHPEQPGGTFRPVYERFQRR